MSIQQKTKLMHKEIRQLTNKKNPINGGGCIKDKNGKIIFDKTEVLTRWADYVTELFDDQRNKKLQYTTMMDQQY